MRQEKEFGEPENLEIGKCYCYYCFSSKMLSVFKMAVLNSYFDWNQLNKVHVIQWSAEITGIP